MTAVEIVSKNSLTRPTIIFWILFSIIVILGVTLRVYGLTRQSLWLDEANGIRIAEMNYPEIVSQLKHDVSPPLHYFLLHIWMKVFGSGELSVRCFASIFGICLIPVMYYVGSDMFNRRTGLASAFIASIAQFHVMFSQEVRMYSMLSLLGLLSMYFLYKSLITDNRTYWFLYTLVTALAIYTHNYGIFIAISGTVFFLIYAKTHKTQFKKFLMTQGCLAVLYLPWLPILVKYHIGSQNIVGWIPKMQVSELFATFKVLGGLRFDILPPAINNLITGAGLVVFGFCFILGLFPSEKQKSAFYQLRENIAIVMLFSYLLATLAIPMLISIKKPIFFPGRYCMAAWPVFNIVLGHGIARLKNSSVKVIMLMFIACFACVSLYWYYFKYTKGYARSIANFIQLRANENDVMVFVPNFIDNPINYYLHMSLQNIGYPRSSRNEPTHYQSASVFPRRPDMVVELTKSKLVGGSGMIFFIHRTSADSWIPETEALKKLFDETFTKIESKKFGKTEITVYHFSGNT